MALILQLNIGDLVGGHINVIDVAFHQLILEAVILLVIHGEGADVAVHEELVLEGGLVIPVGIPVTVALDAQVHGLTVIGVKQVLQNLGGGHIGIAVGVRNHAVQIPAELASRITIYLSVAVEGQAQDLVAVALAPLGVVLVHVLVGQLVGLAVFVGPQSADLNTSSVSGIGSGVHEHDGAIITSAQGDPDMAVHGEDVAGLELMALIDAAAIAILIDPGLSGGFIHQHIAHVHGAPALVGSKDTSLLSGGHYIALIVSHGAVFGVQQVVNCPAHIAGAVNTSVIILVPCVVGIVTLSGIGILVVVGLVLALEEVDPALRQADGHGLVGGVHILPIPGAAIDVQGSAHRLHSGSQEVLQGQLAGHAADRGGVVLGNKHPEQLGYMVIRVYYDADGLILLKVIKLDVLNSGPAGLGGDVIELSILVDRKGLIVHLDPPVAVIIGPHAGQDTGHIALFHLGGGNLTVINGDVVDIALLELVLDLELAVVSGNGKGLFMAIHKEAVLKRFLLILGDLAIVLHSQVDSVVASGCPGGIP